MNRQFDTIKKGRSLALGLVKDLSVEQLNKVPPGFNNNIIWNLGHLVAAQQGVCYKRAGVDMIVPESFFTAYKPDSRPGDFVSEEEVAEIRDLLHPTIDRLEADYARGLLNEYPSWVTRYGVNIGSIEDAISFLPFHEGMHIGYIMALKRMV